jgi:D-alanyl-D-alanine endopeptidase (penicillin-binding protein 7)
MKRAVILGSALMLLVQSLPADEMSPTRLNVGYPAPTTSRQTAPPQPFQVASSIPATYAAQRNKLQLRSSSALVIDQEAGRILYAKDADNRRAIASITKLMTAMVVLDAHQDLNAKITITTAEIDRLRGTSSRLAVGTTLTRYEMLQLALMSSENRAAAALARAYPGGTRACIEAMNEKAVTLGMRHTRFMDPTGLHGGNVSTARDLSQMVNTAADYPLIHKFTTQTGYEVRTPRQAAPLQYRNTNRLVSNDNWRIGVSKTGYINEAGRCLVMQAQMAGKPVIIVLLNSQGKLSGIGDAGRIRKWIESIESVNDGLS